MFIPTIFSVIEIEAVVKTMQLYYFIDLTVIKAQLVFAFKQTE